MSDTWKPAVTVAAIIEEQGRFLLVEETTPDGIRLNQPAGHLEPGESPQQGVIREALEETAYDFTPTALVGVYLSRNVSSARTGKDATYLRMAFAGKPGTRHDRALDAGILQAVWMTRDEIAACTDRHRSPLVLQCIDDYLAGQQAPLSLVVTHSSVFGK